MEEKNTFIVRCGEVALKGMNKPYFERVLVQRISKALKKYDGAEVKRQEGLYSSTLRRSMTSRLSSQTFQRYLA